MSVIRCRNRAAHGERPGNILVVVEGNTILVKCSDRKCKSWTRITFAVPGVSLNFEDAAITTETVELSKRFNPTQQAIVEC